MFLSNVKDLSLNIFDFSPVSREVKDGRRRKFTTDEEKHFSQDTTC